MRSASKISHEDKVNLCAELYERGMSTRDIQKEIELDSLTIIWTVVAVLAALVTYLNWET